MTKDINIARTLLRMRREKGVTQEELAEFMGVTKASVSKWETGTSYPDIAFLPQLATFFDISIDELMDYNPQMTEENIRELRQRLTKEAAERPFEETLEECQELIKKYYSCYPLLMQIGLFLLNNAARMTTPEEAQRFLLELAMLFARIHDESDEANLAQEALAMQAYCYIGASDPDAALVLLEDSQKAAAMPTDLLAASAYRMKGQTSEAKKTLQIGLFQNLVLHVNYLVNYLTLVTEDTEAFTQTIARFNAVSAAYNLSNLHPYLQIQFDLMSAVGYAEREEVDQSIDALERCHLLIKKNSLSTDLHGDAYFTLIDDWLRTVDNGGELPRNSMLLEGDLIAAITTHPAFASLSENKRYKKLVNTLDKLKEEKEN